LSRQCGILDISQPYRPPQPVTGIASLPFTRDSIPRNGWGGGDLIPPITAEVKKTWIYTFIPIYAFMVYTFLPTGASYCVMLLLIVYAII
jgi:hypothetical protein